MLAEDVDRSLGLAANCTQLSQTQRSLLSELEKSVQSLQQNLSDLHARTLPTAAVWRPAPPKLAYPGAHEHKAAILVPYRDRELQLSEFLPQLSAFLAVSS